MKRFDIVGVVKLPWKPGNHEKDRNFFRRVVVNIFLEEEPGTGGGNQASRYEYVVERTSVGNIYLSRPAHLKKGFDFLINLENWKFKNNRFNPSHDDIFIDIKRKKEKMPLSMFEELCSCIERVYFCCEPEDLLRKAFKSYEPLSGELPVDALLKILKWFFIEQDIRDWNYSGRGMLMKEIEKICKYR